MFGLAATFAAATGWDLGAAAVADDRTPRYPVPGRACDCHVHVFDPERYPYAPTRSYTPGHASLTELIAFEAGIDMQRLVVVQPSVYGSDNSCLVDALRHLGDRARGVAVIDAARISDGELDALDAAGVRSVRVNLEAKGHRDPKDAGKTLSEVATRVRTRGWTVQVYAALPVIAGIADTIANLPVNLVVDHHGGARASDGRTQPGFDALLALLKSGKVYAKLSAPYRASEKGPAFDDMEDVTKALIAAAPDRLVWASDWPHTGGGATGSDDRKGRALTDIEPFRAIDVQAILTQLSSWCDQAIWIKILEKNPERLYFFR